jgi:hypothetical protein
MMIQNFNVGKNFAKNNLVIFKKIKKKFEKTAK